MSVEAFAERDGDSVILNVNTQRSEHTFLLREAAARRLLVDLIHETDADIGGGSGSETMEGDVW